MGRKNRRKSPKYSAVIRLYAPQRFGFQNIDHVKCMKCGVEQFYTTCRGDGHKVKLVEVHHIIPVSECPELQNDYNNMMFLCQTHHKEFHVRYDKKYKDEKGNNRVASATLEDLQVYLGLTAKDTIFKQMRWKNENDQVDRTYNYNNAKRSRNQTMFAYLYA